MSKNERDYCQKEVQEMLGKSRATIFRWREKGLMPQPYDEGPNILYWDRAEFDEWLRNRRVRNARPVRNKAPVTSVTDDNAGSLPST